MNATHSWAIPLFLVGVGVVGVAPLGMLAVWAVRRKARADLEPTAVARAAPAPRAGGSRVLSIALLATTVLATSAGTYLVVSARSSTVPDARRPTSTASATVLPQSFAGLPAIEMTTGQEAVDAVMRLHGTNIPVTAAAIARYSGSGGKAEVWVAVSEDSAGATKLAQSMARKIGEGKSPFSTPQHVNADVWMTQGLDQVHYFFARGTGVWWVSADPGLAERALAEVLALAGS